MQATISNAPHPSAPPTCHGRWMSPEFEPGLVSVIVPTYNRAHLIIETLDSVFAQTYRPIELLIIDDGSTDNTAEVVREWKEQHEEDGFAIHFFTQENRGAPAARNLGLIESRGEFIQFLDSDDLIHSEKHSKQVAAFRSTEAAEYVFSQNALFSDKKDWSLAPYSTNELDASLEHHVSARNFIGTADGVYRRNICLKIGPWNESLKRGQEREYNTRMLMAASRTRRVQGVYTLVRIHDSGRISDQASTAAGVRAATEATQAVARSLLAHSCFEQPLRNVLAKHLAAEGWTALKLADFELAAQCARCGWQLKPCLTVRWRILFVELFSRSPAIMFRSCVYFARMLPENSPFRHAFVTDQ